MTKNKEVTCKDVENMLYNYNTLRAQVVDIELDIQSLKNEYMGLTGAGWNDIKPTSPTYAVASTVEAEIVNKDSRIEKLNKVKTNKEIEVKRVENMLTILREDERELVELKYFKKIRAKMIAYKMNLCEEAIRKNNALILSSLANFLNQKLGKSWEKVG